MRVSRFFTPKVVILLSGLAIGALAALAVRWGNPGNMGICVACFLRDVSGALGLHRASAVQYIRPEIIGFVFGALVTALVFREFRSRGGSAPLIRFLLGMSVMVGALVFLGCPIRATLRLAGGDLNGITGLAGTAVGALVGIYFLKSGFSLGRSTKMSAAAGWVMPAFMAALLALLLVGPGFILFSTKGPGAMHAPIAISLGLGLVVGFLAQRTRMCFVGAWRDLALIRDSYLAMAVVGVLAGALVLNLALGQFHLGFSNQPIAHTDHLWNFLGMVVVGLGATLVGGCPLRQLVLTGEGDTDAGMTVLGLLAGAAVAHNFGLASSTAGATIGGKVAVVVALIVLAAIGFAFRVRVAEAGTAIAARAGAASGK
ncbi:MAG: YedE family putative selenium transporter [Chloroflexota bacterium]